MPSWLSISEGLQYVTEKFISQTTWKVPKAVRNLSSRRWAIELSSLDVAFCPISDFIAICDGQKLRHRVRYMVRTSLSTILSYSLLFVMTSESSVNIYHPSPSQCLTRSTFVTLWWGLPTTPLLLWRHNVRIKQSSRLTASCETRYIDCINRYFALTSHTSLVHITFQTMVTDDYWWQRWWINAIQLLFIYVVI
jgi:hypothetical protein